MTGELVMSVVGGLGNQLYCWATAVAVARRAGLEAVLELSSYERDPYGRVYLLTKFGISNLRTASFNSVEQKAISALSRISDRGAGRFKLAGRSIYTEPGGHVNQSLLNDHLSGHCYLRGYWQSPRYFSDCAGEIRKAVTFKPCNEVNRSADAVCVHIRSFKEAPKQKIGRLSRGYYEASYVRCFQRFSEPKFVVYSDDFKWAEERGMLPATYEAADQTHSEDCADHDLCELVSMSRFQNFIIANSSFSWWAAYLSNGSPWVQAPERHSLAWFSSDPLPDSWESQPVNWNEA